MNTRRTHRSSAQLLWAVLLLATPMCTALAVGHIPFIVAVALSAAGTLCGVLLYRLDLPDWVSPLALLFIIAVFVALLTRGRPLGFLCFNWLAGVFAGSFLGKFLWGPPVGSQERAQQFPGWHLNGVRYTDEEILDHLHRELSGLDAGVRSAMTIMNGNMRLDIIRSSVDGFAVYCTEDVRAAKNWSMLLDLAKPSTPIEMKLGPDEARLPANTIVGIGLALRAADSFITNRRPDPELNWLTGDEAFSRRAPSLGQ